MNFLFVILYRNRLVTVVNVENDVSLDVEKIILLRHSDMIQSNQYE